MADSLCIVSVMLEPFEIGALIGLGGKHWVRLDFSTGRNRWARLLELHRHEAGVLQLRQVASSDGLNSGFWGVATLDEREDRFGVLFSDVGSVRNVFLKKRDISVVIPETCASGGRDDR